MKAGKPGSSVPPTGIRDDLEEEDVEESYYRYMEENPNAGLVPVDEENPDIEYDEDGNPIPPDKKKIIDPLPPIDHNNIDYKPFQKEFYTEHEDIKCLTDKEVCELRKTLGITVTGRDAPKPVSSFGHLNFEEKLIKAIIRAEYTTPTPIQAQAVPCALLGRDVLGIAQTGNLLLLLLLYNFFILLLYLGSGKTAAFLWPLLIHVSTQPPVEEGQGPIALILAPTRELAIQIYNEAKRFARIYNLRIVCAYGGGSKWEQSQVSKIMPNIFIAVFNQHLFV